MGDLIQNYKKRALFAATSLPVFIPIILLGIKPYWPKNIIGWLIIVFTPFILEFLLLSLFNYIEKRKKQETNNEIKMGRLVTAVVLLIPIVIIAVIGVTKGTEYVQHNYFILKP
jgi:heme/copper-type cytochrome/quinol oxidase subunit 2